MRAAIGTQPGDPELEPPRAPRRRAAEPAAAAEPDVRAEHRRARWQDARALGLLALALFLGGVLLSAAWNALTGGEGGDSVRGPFGVIGTWVATPLLTLLGWTGALFLPFAPLAHALRRFGQLSQRDDRNLLLLLGGCALLMPIVVALAFDVGTDTNLAVGLWGGMVAFYAVKGFGTFGAWLLVVLAACVLTVLALAWNPVRALLAGRPQEPAAAALADEDEAAGAVGPAPRRRRKKPAEDLAVALEPAPEEMPALDPVVVAQKLATPPAAVAAQAPAADEAARKARRTKAETRADSDAAAVTRLAAEMQAADASAETLAERPPKGLLAEAPPRNAEVGRRELDAAAQRLEEVLRTFKIDGRITGRTVGPTVTQFEYEPAAGVKVRQIASLSDDLALAMRAPSIRIVAPIPGKGAVGIEVPNATREMVVFRELVESTEFDQAKAALPIALGKDLEGKPVVADLAKMPHLLIAGATGAGKSVAVNTIITSLIYRHTPETLRFLMVDPKMVELSVYNDLPHMRHKVITDSKDAASVLKWALLEMEERYELLAANGCRNLQDFNRRARDGSPLLKPRNPEVAFEDRTYTKGALPYIVVIIDEMADLMMTVQGEVETPIARLAQKARAIGIHLIIATQRPSVNVITGLIKANFPSRIAFRVASQVDSRTILDGVGAETLLGNGDMLFIPPGKSEPSRLQGAFLSSEETERLMDWYRDRKAGTSSAARELAEAIDQAQAADEEDILEVVRRREAIAAGDASGDDGAADGERDKLFFEAAEVCIQNQGGSTSLLQRRLKIGYGRAARVIDQLHLAGILGPPDGSKPRDVLVGIEDLPRFVGGGHARD
ncbi:DNA translocase FtsK [Roseisolibacter sp. H3M3-2]|uniref:FtsK/SpoIIIE family DNA translocase n=1 Tax=Roseisolibacter sp. H3M3-2 TaxID=3031323 RepID=UPI0023DB4EFD|nr:DNA translocase FtsK [Roseisolibacter sp. H3M3-2]MDF1502697.1 DNA translocase FtsK 4TM domain-containing protein [Roseisolibacter sp. H3M3-2]